MAENFPKLLKETDPSSGSRVPTKMNPKRPTAKKL